MHMNLKVKVCESESTCIASRYEPELVNGAKYYDQQNQQTGLLYYLNICIMLSEFLVCYRSS